MNEELKVIISAEIDNLKKGVAEAKQEVENFAKKSKVSFADFQSAVDSASKVSNGILKATGTAVAGVATALGALAPATAEYRAEQAKLTSAFETAGASADVAKGVYNDLYRVMGESDTAVEAANHLAQITTNQKDLAEWTEICQGIYATFGDSLPIEGLTEAANETIKVGKVTGSLADALNWAGISEDEFNEKLVACANETERAKLVQETLTSAYDDAAAAYEKNAESILAQNEAQSAMNDAMAELGETMQPVMTALTQLGADVLKQLAPYLQEFADKYLPTIVEKLSDLGTKIGEVISWIAEHWGVISTIGGIVLAIAAAVSTLSAGLTIYNGVMAITAAVTSPVGAIIIGITAGIVALGVAIVLCVKYWDEIKEACSKAVKAVKEYVSDMVDKVTEYMGKLKTTISQKADEAKQAITQKYQEIKTGVTEKVSETKQAVVNKFEEIKTGITEKVDATKQAVTNKFNEAKTAVTNTVNSIKSTTASAFNAVKSTATNAWNGVKSAVTNAVNNTKSSVSNAWNSIKSTTSSVFNSVKSTATNAWNGVVNAIKNAMTKAKDTVSSAVSKLKSLMNFKWKLPDLKLPHISISGKFSINPPSVPKFSIKWYQHGGVFDKPTLFGYGRQIGGLGENGAEAIVPLEKNTKWLEIIADKLAAKQGNTPIVLQVDGKTFAQTTVKSLNDLRRQTGSVGINLM